MLLLVLLSFNTSSFFLFLSFSFFSFSFLPQQKNQHICSFATQVRGRGAASRPDTRCAITGRHGRPTGPASPAPRPHAPKPAITHWSTKSCDTGGAKSALQALTDRLPNLEVWTALHTFEPSIMPVPHGKWRCGGNWRRELAAGNGETNHVCAARKAALNIAGFGPQFAKNWWVAEEMEKKLKNKK